MGKMTEAQWDELMKSMSPEDLEHFIECKRLQKVEAGLSYEFFDGKFMFLASVDRQGLPFKITGLIFSSYIELVKWKEKQ